MKTASATALQVLSEHIQAWPGDFWKHDGLEVQVVDDSGLHLLTLTIGATFSPALRNRSQIARPDGHERLDNRESPVKLPPGNSDA
jgi:hypothetical protein